MPEDVISYKRSFGNQQLVVYGNLSGESVSVAGVPEISMDNVLIGNYSDAVECFDGTIELRPYEFVAVMV